MTTTLTGGVSEDKLMMWQVKPSAYFTTFPYTPLSDSDTFYQFCAALSKGQAGPSTGRMSGRDAPAPC